MLTLSLNSLSVDLLNPADARERSRLGTRYCWGGYIWQVNDEHVGPLLTGPEWPNPTPTPFNGQGAPESFRHTELGTDRPLILENGRGFIIGIGEVAPGDDQPIITKPCPWTVTRTASAMDFYTVQSAGAYGCRLSRRIALEGRALNSFTKIVNTGTKPLPVHWFAHPFFALTNGLITCGLPRSWDIAENPGFGFDAERRLAPLRIFKNATDGHFQPLIVGDRTPLRAAVSHPRLSKLFFSTDFTPDQCPVWGNSNTWSIEPYIVAELAPGATRSWTLTYEFGAVTEAAV